MQVGDLVKYHPGLLHTEGETLQIGIAYKMDTDVTVQFNWPGREPEWVLVSALDVVSENRPVDGWTGFGN